MDSGSAAAGGSPAFASTDPGFEPLPVERLLVEHELLLARLKLCYGADRHTFERDLMPLVHRYAAYVHLLPATPDNYFRAPGGLLRLGLEAAFFALQGTDAHIFSGKATISARRELEPRWRLATFVGGLCCELHRVLSHLMVTTPDGEEWPSFMLPLSDWLRQCDAPRYFVRWRPRAAESRGLGLFALPMVVPAQILENLRHGDGAIVRLLFASIGGVPQHREHNVLDDLIRRSLALVVDRDLQARADRYGAPQYGSHVERYLIDAMRRLAAGHSAWTANLDKGRLWFGEDGLFLAWPGSARDILELVEADQLAGIPKSPDTLLDILLDAEVLQAEPAGNRTWAIFPTGSKTPISAVRLASPAIVLASTEPMPAPLRRPLLRAEPATPPAPVVDSHARAPAGRPEPPTAPPSQLSLIEPDSFVPVVELPRPEAPTAAPPMGPPPVDGPPHSPPTPEPRPIRLNAPMRLSPAVRRALAEAIGSFGGPSAAPSLFMLPEGLFVSLAEFERRGVQPTVALRSLADAEMLFRPRHGGPPTATRDVNGVATLGIVLLPRHVDRADPRALAAGTEAGP